MHEYRAWCGTNYVGIFVIIDLRSLQLDEDIRIHEPSPQGVLEDDCPRSLESETSSPKASTSDSDARSSTTTDSDPRVNQNWRGFFRILKKGPQHPFPTFPPKSAPKPKLTRRKSKRIREDFIPQLNSPALRSSFDADFCRFKSSWKNYSLLDLQVATNNFSQGLYSHFFRELTLLWSVEIQ